MDYPDSTIEFGISHLLCGWCWFKHRIKNSTKTLALMWGIPVKKTCSQTGLSCSLNSYWLGRIQVQGQFAPMLRWAHYKILRWWDEWLGWCVIYLAHKVKTQMILDVPPEALREVTNHLALVDASHSSPSLALVLSNPLPEALWQVPSFHPPLHIPHLHMQCLFLGCRCMQEHLFIMHHHS